ncbi:MAG: PhzF family phenazine biosynthesis protein [Bacteroidales bacterium]|nr:PhzF family phenazine biosynthesis protein [Bacteroidales bacterium]
MKKTISYHIIDVFAPKPYSGNPLGVFFDFGKLRSEEMQKIAKELNFSETTFITSSSKQDGSFPIRIFTPASEIPFAGHPTLGTAYILLKYLESSSCKKIFLSLPVGNIPVSVEDDEFWMTQQQPEFGRELPKQLLENVLGLQSSDFIESYPVMEVSTGLPFTIVPLNSLDALKKASVEEKAYHVFIQTAKAKGILVYCSEPYETHHQIAARVFVPYLGIPEDPATGSAAGCLAAYLLKINPNAQIDLNIGQGYEIGRPSEIKIKAYFEDGKYHIRVGGVVKEIAKGEWNIGM